MNRSYGYSASSYGVLNGTKPVYQGRASAICHPSLLMAFADLVDWRIDSTTANNYVNTSPQEHAPGAVAYRYHGSAAVVCFDGHRALLRRDQVVNNRSLFFNNPWDRAIHPAERLERRFAQKPGFKLANADSFAKVFPLPEFFPESYGQDRSSR